MSQTKLYLSDTTILIDLFWLREKGYSSTALDNFNNWIDTVAENPSAKIVTNSVCAAEFVRQLFFDHGLSRKRINYWMDTIQSAFDIEIVEYTFHHICSMVALLEDIAKGHSIDIGELTLLSYAREGFDVVFASSDSGPLKSFDVIKRCNPEKGNHEYQQGEIYV